MVFSLSAQDFTTTTSQYYFSNTLRKYCVNIFIYLSQCFLNKINKLIHESIFCNNDFNYLKNLLFYPVTQCDNTHNQFQLLISYYFVCMYAICYLYMNNITTIYIYIYTSTWFYILIIWKKYESFPIPWPCSFMRNCSITVNLVRY